MSQQIHGICSFKIDREQSLSFPSMLRDNKIARDRSAKRAARARTARSAGTEKKEKERRFFSCLALFSPHSFPSFAYFRLFLSLVGFSRTKTDCSQSSFKSSKPIFGRFLLAKGNQASEVIPVPCS